MSKKEQKHHSIVRDQNPEGSSRVVWQHSISLQFGNKAALCKPSLGDTARDFRLCPGLPAPCSHRPRPCQCLLGLWILLNPMSQAFQVCQLLLQPGAS